MSKNPKASDHPKPLIPADVHALRDAGALSGALAGAAVGAVAGPAGAIAGGVIGTAIGAFAGAAMDDDETVRTKHDKELDRELGVTEGPLGVTEGTPGVSAPGGDGT